ncbi:MAG: ABC transporter substrate-binding protein [Desulfobacula sp.]|nr:ABC transporter substrate-binding protein [Desulfobacula sp.]
MRILITAISLCFGLNTAICFGAESVKIAAIFAKTGIASVQNAPYIQMIEFGVEEINQRGGVNGNSLKLIVLDNKSTPIGSTMAAKQAVKLKVAAVVGSGLSSHSLAAAPILQQEGIPMITPVSTNPKVTKIGNYIFRICFIDSFQGAAMAKFAHKDLKAATAVVLKNVDEAYSLTLGEYFTEAFINNGGKILWEGTYRGKAVEFSDILNKTASLNPDTVYIPGYIRDSGLIIKQAKSIGLRSIFLGGDAWAEIYSYGGKAVEGSYHSAPWHPDVHYEKSVHLSRRYKQIFKKEISNTSAPLSYDAVMVLADAIERARSFESSKIRDALAQTNDFPGATGKITFDEFGDPKGKEVIILKLENGKKTYYKSIKP